ncbi:Pepco domain-containing protein [Leptolyngbya iicbica]|uniref:Pepco domain-containing protein n=2 Tax=Cyanophyceae TaxID=3028117 RepID=A0A4Q7E363_9CYAN|nr:hypothetical protein [Leptolyngbya sp. LK]RZM76063.1 hypothetical protein DYY88_19410 [Leptolyngbya sp. LK]
MANTIIVVTEDIPDGEKGLWGDAQNVVRRLREVKLPTDLLEQNMLTFLQMVGGMFTKVDTAIGAEADLKLDEVELSVEISTEGEVKLVAGGKAAGKGAITLKFKRNDPT